MDLISQLVSQLGIDRNAAEGAAGGVLAAVKEQAPGPEADAVLAKVPEAESWIGKAQALAGGSGGGGALGGLGAALGGGGLGGALGGLGGALGGGGLGALTGVLGKLGIGADKLGVVLPLVVQFLQARAGNDLVGKLLAKVPFLAQAGGGLGGALGGLFGGR